MRDKGKGENGKRGEMKVWRVWERGHGKTEGEREGVRGRERGRWEKEETRRGNGHEGEGGGDWEEGIGRKGKEERRVRRDEGREEEAGKKGKPLGLWRERGEGERMGQRRKWE